MRSVEPVMTCDPHEMSRRELLLRASISASGLALLPLMPSLASSVGSADRATRIDAFDLGNVRLLAGPFADAQNRDAKYLLQLDPDRLLHSFRSNAGLAPKAQVYGGWESQQPWVDIRCQGHTLGHYLGACAAMYAATATEAFRQRVEYIVTELRACQRAAHTGIICAFPDGTVQLERSLRGESFVGVPWYTMHKLFAGLRDAHQYARCADALEVLLPLAAWLADKCQQLSDAQLQVMLNTEHGGMNEVLADIYALTNDRLYLRLAERFCHQVLLKPLIERRDTLDGLHSNTQIPKVIGLSRLHDLTGKAEYRVAAEFFWRTVTERRSFVTGGNGDNEHFFPIDEFAKHLYSAKTMETCCVHNMLRLTRSLLQRAPQAPLADYYERALYNAILASQDPVSGMMTYFQSTRPGYVKLYCTATESFWCCTGSGMENHARYGDSIYFHDEQSLYVNLYIASSLHWPERDLQLRLTTTFPNSELVQFELQLGKPTRLVLKLRQPAWCANPLVKVNGQSYRAGRSASYLAIDRLWKHGDRVELCLPMRLHMETLPGEPDIAALLYGPVVLAGCLGTTGITPGADIIVNERAEGEMLDLPMALPELALESADLENRVRRLPGESLSFVVRGHSPARDIELVPYHSIAHERYSLYWRLRRT
jgi:uncharacterized protein